MTYELLFFAIIYVILYTLILLLDKWLDWLGSPSFFLAVLVGPNAMAVHPPTPPSLSHPTLPLPPLPLSHWSIQGDGVEHIQGIPAILLNTIKTLCVWYICYDVFFLAPALHTCCKTWNIMCTYVCTIVHFDYCTLLLFSPVEGISIYSKTCWDFSCDNIHGFVTYSTVPAGCSRFKSLRVDYQYNAMLLIWF